MFQLYDTAYFSKNLSIINKSLLFVENQILLEAKKHSTGSRSALFYLIFFNLCGIIVAMEDLKLIIGNNISQYRKIYNMTQIELAEKINYSDKSISKWEKGDGVPDIYVLKSLADIFNVTVNDLITEHKNDDIRKPAKNKKKRYIVILLSVALVWLVAVAFFVLFKWIMPERRCWLAFVFALPETFIVLLVMSKLWLNKIFRFFSCTGIVWTSIMTFCTTFVFEGSWMLYLVGIPLQIMIILWYGFIAKSKK